MRFTPGRMIAAVAFLIAAATQFRTIAARPEPENAPDPRTRTFPHVEWASNYEKGAPRVLFVVNGQSAWEVYALASRMDIEFDVFYTNGGRAQLFAPETDYYHEGIRLYPEAVTELRGLLNQEWDAIAFLECPPYILPAELHFMVLKKLTDGTGIAAFSSNRWQTSFRYPGITETKTTDLFESMPRAGLTLPDYREKARQALNYTQIGKLLPSSWETVTSPYEFTPVTVRTVGKGTIYEFDAGGANYFGGAVLHPAKRQDPDEYFQNEYFYGLAAKLVYAAAARSPDILVTLKDVDGQVFRPAAPLTLSAQLSAPFSGQAHMVVRTHRGEVVHEMTQDLAVAAAGAVELPLPGIAAGRYYADLWLKRAGKTVNWASAYFEVRAEAPRLASLSLGSHSFQPDGTVDAQVRIEGGTAQTTLTARILDAGGRILVDQTGVRIGSDGTATIQLPLDRTREFYHQMEVQLIVDGNPVDRVSEWFCVPRPWEDDLFVFTDNGATNLDGARRRKIFRQYGITTSEIGSDAIQLDPRPVLASGLHISTRIWTTHCHPLTGGCISSPTYADALSRNFEGVARYLEPFGLTFFSVGDDSGVGQDFCDSAPVWIRSYVEKISRKYNGDFNAFFKDHFPDGQRKWGAWQYMAWHATLADIAALPLLDGEMELIRECWRQNYGSVTEFNRASGTTFENFESVTPEDLKKLQYITPCLLGFQDAMREKYGAIEKLNEAWQTDLVSFDNIKNPVIEGLVAEGKYGAKLDKNRYLEELFLRNMASAARGVRRVSDRIGVGMGAASIGNIIPEVLQHIDSVMPYKGDRDIEVIRSFPHRFCGQTIGVYGGKNVPASARENQAWETVLSGGNFIWFWSMVTGGLMGDLSMNPGRSGVMLENIREMQSGIARALIRAERLHDGIGILHSRRAGSFSSLVKELGAVESSQTAFQHIIEDLGMQYRYTSSDEVENGILATDEFRVLLVPYTQILSAQEAAAITSFVQNGGLLIADLRPGTHNLSGQPHAKGSLDDLFGIEQNCGNASPAKGTMHWTQGFDGTSIQTPVAIDGLRGDASVKAKTAVPLGVLGEDTPVVLINDVGKGHAVLLNHAPTTYDILLNRGQAAAIRRLYRALFQMNGADRRFAVSTPDGSDVAGAEIAVFKNGPIEYLTLEKRSFEFETYPQMAVIQLPEERDVYNVRTGEHLGWTDRIPLELRGLGCYVFALLPYQDNGFEASIPAGVRRGGEITVAVQLAATSAANTGPHTIRVDVFQPDGDRLWPMYKLETENGKAAVTVPAALNEKTGNWKISVTDVTTGKQITRQVMVE